MTFRPLSTAVLLAAACSMGGGAFAQTGTIAASGNVRVNGISANGSSPNNPLNANDVRIADGNNGGSGSLALAGGATATVVTGVVGTGPQPATGLLSVSGFGTSWAGQNLNVGVDGGRGVVRALDGGLISLNQSLLVGSGNGDTGLLEVDGFGTLSARSGSLVSGRGEVSGGGSLSVGTGTLAIGAGGTFTLDLEEGGELRAGTLTLGPSSFNAPGSGSLRIGGDSSARLGTGRVNAGGSIELGGGSLTADFLELANGSLTGDGRFNGDLRILNANDSRGRLTVDAGDTLVVRRDGQFQNAIDNRGLVENDGTLDLGASVFGNNQNGSYLGRGGTFRGAQFQNEGFGAAVDLLSGANAFDADFINSPGRRVTVTGGATATFQQDLVNNGTLRIDPGSRATVVGRYSGAGDLLGGGDAVFLGDFSPGNSPAVINVGLASTFGPSSNFILEIAGTDRAVPQYDGFNFRAGGSYDFDNGTLSVVVLDDFAPAFGDEFEIFRFEGFAAPPVTGGFGDSEIAQLGGGLSFDVSTLLSDGFIRVVPEPGSVALLLAGAGLLLRRRRVG